MIGLKRNTVKLEMHQSEWDVKAAETIAMLKEILGPVAVDIQHIGSTSIQTIHAKPILDLVIGVNNLEDIKACIPAIVYTGKNDIRFKGEKNMQSDFYTIRRRPGYTVSATYGYRKISPYCNFFFLSQQQPV